jgi:hypothetical protein
MGFEHKKYEVAARDNTCNRENDFNHDFTWSIWSNKPSGDGCIGAYADVLVGGEV